MFEPFLPVRANRNDSHDALALADLASNEPDVAVSVAPLRYGAPSLQSASTLVPVHWYATRPV
jgi:hypothetical protein